MRITVPLLLLLSLLAAAPARADLHVTRDHGGYVEPFLEAVPITETRTVADLCRAYRDFVNGR